MNGGSWSIATKLTRVFTIATGSLVLTIGGISAWYVWEAARQETRSRLQEALSEMDGLCRQQTIDANALDGPVAEIRQRRPETPIAWSIWYPGGQKVWVALDNEARLLERASLSTNATDLGTVQSFDGDLRGMVMERPDGTVFGAVIDFSSRLGGLRSRFLIGGVLVVVTMICIVAAARVMLGRVSRTLRQVAEGARSVHGTGEQMNVDLREAPDEIREIVSALQEMLANVHAEAERNRVFTASLAHELRSPIQNLMGETEVALMTPRDGGEYRRVLVSHLQELRDLADAVDNLVTICSDRKVAQDALQTRESFDLAPEASLRLAREKSYAAARGVQLNLESKGDTRLYGDREGLLRAMRNLTANAIEWSSPGSQVDVQVRGENGRVIVTVDDAGPGVPEELRERIFDPFFRGPQAKGRRIGYGLGLAIVRRAVDSQGGAVEVGRSPRGGARFCMSLPRNLHRPPSDETPTPAHA